MSTKVEKPPKSKCKEVQGIRATTKNTTTIMTMKTAREIQDKSIGVGNDNQNVTVTVPVPLTVQVSGVKHHEKNCIAVFTQSQRKGNDLNALARVDLKIERDLQLDELIQEVRYLFKEGKITVHSVMSAWAGSPFGAVEAFKMADSNEDEIETKFSCAIFDIIDMLGNLQREDIWAFWNEGKKDGALKNLVPLAKETATLSRKLQRITALLSEYAQELHITVQLFQAGLNPTSDVNGNALNTPLLKMKHGKSGSCYKFRKAVRSAWCTISGSMQEKKPLLALEDKDKDGDRKESRNEAPNVHGNEQSLSTQGQKQEGAQKDIRATQPQIPLLHVRPEIHTPDRNKSDTIRFNNVCNCHQSHCAGHCGRQFQYQRRPRIVPPPLTLEQLQCHHHHNHHQHHHSCQNDQYENHNQCQGQGYCQDHCKGQGQCHYENHDRETCSMKTNYEPCYSRDQNKGHRGHDNVQEEVQGQPQSNSKNQSHNDSTNNNSNTCNKIETTSKEIKVKKITEVTKVTKTIPSPNPEEDPKVKKAFNTEKVVTTANLPEVNVVSDQIIQLDEGQGQKHNEAATHNRNDIQRFETIIKGEFAETSITEAIIQENRFQNVDPIIPESPKETSLGISNSKPSTNESKGSEHRTEPKMNSVSSKISSKSEVTAQPKPCPSHSQNHKNEAKAKPKPDLKLPPKYQTKQRTQKDITLIIGKEVVNKSICDYSDNDSDADPRLRSRARPRSRQRPRHRTLSHSQSGSTSSRPRSGSRSQSSSRPGLRGKNRIQSLINELQREPFELETPSEQFQDDEHDDDNESGSGSREHSYVREFERNQAHNDHDQDQDRDHSSLLQDFDDDALEEETYLNLHSTGDREDERNDDDLDVDLNIDLDDLYLDVDVELDADDVGLEEAQENDSEMSVSTTVNNNPTMDTNRNASDPIAIKNVMEDQESTDFEAEVGLRPETPSSSNTSDHDDKKTGDANTALNTNQQQDTTLPGIFDATSPNSIATAPFAVSAPSPVRNPVEFIPGNVYYLDQNLYQEDQRCRVQEQGQNIVEDQDQDKGQSQGQSSTGRTDFAYKQNGNDIQSQVTTATDNIDSEETLMERTLDPLTEEAKEPPRNGENENEEELVLDTEEERKLLSKEVVVVRSAVSDFAESEFGVMDTEDLDWLNKIKEMGQTGYICADEIELAEKLKRQSIFMNCIKYRADEIFKDVKGILETVRSVERKWVDPFCGNEVQSQSLGQGQSQMEGQGNHENGKEESTMGYFELSQLVSVIHSYCAQLVSSYSSTQSTTISSTVSTSTPTPIPTKHKCKHQNNESSSSAVKDALPPNRMTEAQKETILEHLLSLSTEATACHKSFKRFAKMVATDTKFLRELCLNFPLEYLPDFHKQQCRWGQYRHQNQGQNQSQNNCEGQNQYQNHCSCQCQCRCQWQYPSCERNPNQKHQQRHSRKAQNALNPELNFEHIFS